MSILCARCHATILDEPHMPDEFLEEDCDDCKKEDAREATREDDIDQSEFCSCENYTGSERNSLGVKVCERCGKPDDPRDSRPFP